MQPERNETHRTCRSRFSSLVTTNSEFLLILPPCACRSLSIAYSIRHAPQRARGHIRIGRHGAVSRHSNVQGAGGVRCRMARADREPMRAEASMPAVATHFGWQLNVFQVDPHVYLALRFVDVLPPWARRPGILDHLEHGGAAQQADRTHAMVRGTCWRRSVGIAPLPSAQPQTSLARSTNGTLLIARLLVRVHGGGNRQRRHNITGDDDIHRHADRGRLCHAESTTLCACAATPDAITAWIF